MALDTTFAAAYIDNDVHHSLFGRRLYPFSLWHLALLQAINSPFVGTGEVTLWDLKTAVGICSLQYKHSRVKRPVFPLFLKEKELQKFTDAFVDYIRDYYYKPEYEFVVPPPVPGAHPHKSVSHAPGVICTAFRAAHGSRIPIDRAWNMPIGQAFISEAMYFMHKGETLDFLTDDDLKFQAEMKAAGL